MRTCRTFCLRPPAVWVFVTLLPTLLLNTERRDVPLGTRDLVGWTLWGLGFAAEAVADQQKLIFKRDPENAVSGSGLKTTLLKRCLGFTGQQSVGA